MINLSITKDPEWRKDREKLWKDYELKIKGDYRNQEIESFKSMFMDGELKQLEDFNIGNSSLDIFPIKTPDAWEYYLQNIMDGRSPNIMKSWITMALNDSYTLTQLGWNFEERCEFFNWLLGEAFMPELKTKVPVGPNKIWLTYTLDPDWVFWHAIHAIYGWLDVGGEVNEDSDCIDIWAAKLGYLMSLFPLLDKRFFKLKLYTPREIIKPGIKPYHVQFRLQKVLAWMKDYERGGKNKGYVKEREQFLADFKSRLEALDPKPEGLDKLLDKFAR